MSLGPLIFLRGLACTVASIGKIRKTRGFQNGGKTVVEPETTAAGPSPVRTPRPSFRDTTIIRDGDADRCRCHYIVSRRSCSRAAGSTGSECRRRQRRRRSVGRSPRVGAFHKDSTRIIFISSRYVRVCFLSLPNDDICIQAYRAHHLVCVCNTDGYCMCVCVCTKARLTDRQPVASGGTVRHVRIDVLPAPPCPFPSENARELCPN